MVTVRAPGLSLPSCFLRAGPHTSHRQAAAGLGLWHWPVSSLIAIGYSNAMWKFFGLLLLGTGVKTKPKITANLMLKWNISPLRELWQSDKVLCDVFVCHTFSARKKWNVSRWRARHIKTRGRILFVVVCIFLFTPSRESGISVFLTFR